MKTRSARLFAPLLFAMLAAACGSEEPALTGGTGGTTGGGGSTGSGGSTGGGGDYFPFALGNTWEYDVTEVGQATHKKSNKIVRMEAVGGVGPDNAKMVYRVETTKFMTPGAAPGDATISWQLRDGARVLRYREESCSPMSLVLEGGTVKSCRKNEDTTWSPARIRIDESPMGKPLAKDLTWDETFKEAKTTFVPAGAAMGTTVNTDIKQTWKVLDTNAMAQSGAGNFSGCLVLQKTSMNDVPKKYTFCRGIGKVREEGTGQLEVLSKYQIN